MIEAEELWKEMEADVVAYNTTSGKVLLDLRD